MGVLNVEIARVSSHSYLRLQEKGFELLVIIYIKIFEFQKEVGVAIKRKETSS